jgi:hypothetical protein
LQADKNFYCIFLRRNITYTYMYSPRQRPLAGGCFA